MSITTKNLDDTGLLGLDASYDAVVVGARCAGASLAMLLARGGRRVLVVDRASSGSDTISTHALMRPAIAQLRRWGLDERIAASDATPIRSTWFYYGDSVVHVPVKPRGGIDALYAPRRMVLDSLLVNAAREAGARVRHGVSVVGLPRAGRDGRVTGVVLRDAAGAEKHIESSVVIGADGVRSAVARLAGAPIVVAAPHATAVVYGHFAYRGAAGYRWYFRPGIAAGAIPTNDGLACVFVSVAPERFHAEARGRLADFFSRALAEAAPDLAIDLAGEAPRGALVPFPGMRGFMRRAEGPGWRLVGDASHFKDPITAHGMTDALRDVAFLARSIEADAPAGTYEALRDDFALPWLEISDRVASFEWDLPELQRLHLRMRDEMVRESDALERLAAVAPSEAA